VLKARGITRFRLEVLQNNPAAVALYQRLGLKVQRNLDSFSLTAPSAAGAAFEVRTSPWSEIAGAAPALWQWQPSWQNANAALDAAGDNLLCLAAWEGAQLAGYLALYPDRASVAQIAVHPGLRRRGLGRALLSAAGGALGAGDLRVINADAGDAGFAAFMAACNARPLVQQFEMSMPL
jgi:ribosomal protein S18 acetylase RimI-like enzyme